MTENRSPRQTLSYLQRRFAEVGIRPRVQYGQNFLIDLNLLDVLAAEARIGPDDVVLEVGTGTGSLTQRLAALAAQVITVEIDQAMHQLAGEELAGLSNVTLILADVLEGKHRLDAGVLAVVAHYREARRPWKLAANLPYAIATPLIMNLLALDDPPESMTVTIQKELADRLVARPGTKDYGALSVWLQSQATVEILRILPREVFWPRPKVSSAFVRVQYDRQLRERIGDLAFFHRFVRSMFLHRRKFVRAELLSAVKGLLDKPAVDRVLAEAGIDPQRRAEQLSVAEFISLSRAVQQTIPPAAIEYADRDADDDPATDDDPAADNGSAADDNSAAP